MAILSKVPGTVAGPDTILAIPGAVEPEQAVDFLPSFDSILHHAAFGEVYLVRWPWSRSSIDVLRKGVRAMRAGLQAGKYLAPQRLSALRRYASQLGSQPGQRGVWSAAQILGK